MVGCNDQVDILFRDLFQCLVQRAVFEPASGDTAVTGFITRQFFQHFHFGTRMAEHIHKLYTITFRSFSSRLWILSTSFCPSELLVTLVYDIFRSDFPRRLSCARRKCSSCRFYLLHRHHSSTPPETFFSMSMGSRPRRSHYVHTVWPWAGSNRTYLLPVCGNSRQRSVDRFPLVETKVVDQYKRAGFLLQVRQHLKLHDIVAHDGRIHRFGDTQDA